VVTVLGGGKEALACVGALVFALACVHSLMGLAGFDQGIKKMCWCFSGLKTENENEVRLVLGILEDYSLCYLVEYWSAWKE